MSVSATDLIHSIKKGVQVCTPVLDVRFSICHDSDMMYMLPNLTLHDLMPQVAEVPTMAPASDAASAASAAAAAPAAMPNRASLASAASATAA